MKTKTPVTTNPNADATRAADTTAKATPPPNGSTSALDLPKEALLKALDNCLVLLEPLEGSPLDADLTSYDAAVKAKAKITGAIHYVHTITR